MEIEQILDRIKEEFGLKNDNEIARLIGMKTSNFSARKKSGSLIHVLSEWALESDLDLNWILKGEGKNRKSDNYENSDLIEIDKWLSQLVNKEPYRKEWFKAQFEDAFPAFKKWKQRREDSGGEDSGIQTSKIA